MPTFKGTNGPDHISGPLVAGEYDWIDGLEGDDTVTLGPNQTFVSGPGNDTVTGTGTSQYGLWFATSTPYVDLAKGFAQDGFGGTDKLAGIGTVHMAGSGGTVIGSNNNETVFAFAGSKTIDLGGGNDRVVYYQQLSTEYEIYVNAGVYRLKNKASGTEDTLTNIEYIQFNDKVIDTGYAAAKVRADFKYTAYEYQESRMAPAYTYAGVTYPASLVSWFVQAPFTLDLDEDGKLDLVAPMNVGYATGLDTRVPFVALTGGSGTLHFDAVVNAAMPVTAGSRRSADIYLAAINKWAEVTVAHDTGDGKLADLTMLAQGLSKIGNGSPIQIPKLPAALPGRDQTVNAHSMATGDINGDGLDDILIGDWGSPTGAYALLQHKDGTFVIGHQDAFTSITQNWPLDHPGAGQGNNLLVDMSLVDVNGDGYDDLVAGWGHGSTHSYVFLNDHGTFSVSNKVAIPDSIYGEDNQLHMKTLPYDFNGDGTLDLAILWSRYVPYYGGNYIQLLSNDGKGNFTDVTSSRIDKPAQDAMGARLEWTDYWQLLDVNADGAMDIVGQRTGSSSAPVIYLNNGRGSFNVLEVPTSTDAGRIIQWADFDQDGQIELVSFNGSGNATNTSASYQFNIFQLSADSLISSDKRTGTNLRDVLVGDAQNNMLIGNGGNDILDGSAGVDTVTFSGSFSNYQINYNRALGSATITDHRISGDGTDTLKSIEKLQFADKQFDLINPVRTEAPVHSKSQSFLFDPAFYLLKNPDLVPTVNLATAFDSYKASGAARGAAPNAWFDPVYYANKWPDLKSLNLDAATLFAHYNLYGVWEGRSAGPAFDHYDGARYLRDNPDVAAYVDGNVKDFLGSRSNGAIAHYVIYGAAEGRVAYDTDGHALDMAILIGVP